MSVAEHSIPQGLSLLWLRLWHAWRTLFGYDLFVSYRWSDGGAYAQTLVTQLEEKGLIVFIDREETPGGVRVRADIRRNLLRSQGMVVLASSEAVKEHEEITPEIDIFAGSYPRRPVFGIQFDRELETLPVSHPWYLHFHKAEDSDAILWHSEIYGTAALRSLEVSNGTIDFLLKSRALLRRRKHAVFVAIGVAVAIIGVGATGVVSVLQRLEEGQRSLASSRGFEALDGLTKP